MAAEGSSFKLALIQLAVGSDKATNLSRAAEKVREAARNGSKLIALPVSISVFFHLNRAVRVGMFQQSVYTGRSTSRSMRRKYLWRQASLGLGQESPAELCLRSPENAVSSSLEVLPLSLAKRVYPLLHLLQVQSQRRRGISTTIHP